MFPLGLCGHFTLSTLLETRFKDAVFDTHIKKEILNSHISFWLNWDIKTLINRIKGSQKRPVAFDASKNELIELIKKRSIVYSKAMYKIDCENLTKNEIVKDILKIYETH